MFGDGALAFQEFAMGEPLPLATLHEAILGYLRGRDDAVLHGAQAVNAYVGEPRMTQDVDILALDAAAFVEGLRKFLHERFQIALRVRSIKNGVAFRIYQVYQPGNRHLVDVRSVQDLPRCERIADILVLQPLELVVSKVLSYHNRRGQPKAFTDLRDLALLLLKYPELKSPDGSVRGQLEQIAGNPSLLSTWDEIVAREIHLDDDDEDWNG